MNTFTKEYPPDREPLPADCGNPRGLPPPFALFVLLICTVLAT